MTLVMEEAVFFSLHACIEKNTDPCANACKPLVVNPPYLVCVCVCDNDSFGLFHIVFVFPVDAPSNLFQEKR